MIFINKLKGQSEMGGGTIVHYCVMMTNIEEWRVEGGVEGVVKLQQS